MFRDLPNKLADFRVRRKLSQSHVAKLIGCSDRQKIARYEQGKQLPRIDRAACFSSLYGTTVERLFPAVFEAARIDIAERLEALNQGKNSYVPISGTTTILSIYPGVRKCGVAVFSVPNLVTAAVKNVRTTSSNSDLIRKWKHRIGLLLKLYHPNILVIEKPGGMRESPSLRVLVNAIKVLTRRMGIILVEYTLELVRDLLIPFDLDHTKAMLCRLLASQFPDLQQYEPKVKRTIGDTEPYFVSLFMAVALGLTWMRLEGQGFAQQSEV